MFDITFLTLIYLFNFLLVINIIFKQKSNPHNTWAWLFFLCFFPAIGLLLFLFFGRNNSNDLQILKKRNEDLNLEDKFNNYFKNYTSFFYKNNFNDNNEINIFFNGKDKFDSLFDDLKNAKQYIHIQYYIIKNDEVGNTLINILEQKAKEGIEVKLLIDYMGSLRTKKSFLKKLNKIASISYFKLNILSRINTHNHRKICIIDGQCAYIGGFNVGDEYLGKNDKFGFWRDLHIKIKGNSISLIQLSFIKDWNFANKYKTNLLYITPTYFPETKINNKCSVSICTSGVDTTNNVYLTFNDLITKAKKSIYIITPYFVPNETILDNLKLASLNGVNINIIVPNTKDHPFVKYANMAYFNELLDFNINFFLYEKGFIHSKLIIIDKKICSIGSANMDNRSFKINFEISAIIDDKTVTKQVTEQFFNDLRNSRAYTKNDFDNRSNITIIKENISKLISPLL